jgi:L-threonylcarbamoyladenylate synthase
VNAAEIARAAAALKQGWLVAFPTETVYGLGADAENPAAVARIYSTKGRPADHPLIVHVSSAKALTSWARDIPEYADKLAEDFWPGPMTLILRRSDRAGDFVTGGQDTVGLRVPSDTTALALLTEFEKQGGTGVAAPSANRFGKVSPTTAQAVQEELSAYMDPQDMILEGGQSDVGIESTIIDCTGPAPRILRPGAITAAMIERSTGLLIAEADTSIRVSGSLESHYAPTARVVLNHTPEPGDGLIALEEIVTPEGVVRIASPSTTSEYANQLYAALRKADELGLSKVVAVTPEGDDIALAITDRLQRASFPKA